MWFLFSLGGNLILSFKQKELCHKEVRQGSSGAETDEHYCVNNENYCVNKINYCVNKLNYCVNKLNYCVNKFR